MPLMKCDNNGWKWGEGGKCFTGTGARSKALKVGAAIHAQRNDSDDVEIFTDVARYDQGEIIGGTHINQDGFLKTTAIVTRTGVFTYKNLDGTLRKELRHPDDVFQSVSMDSMKMIPITNGHPAERLVVAESAKRLQVGHTGETIQPDGKFIIAPIVITDSQTVNDVQNGKDEISLGYRVDLIKEDGEYQGQQYDHRQTNIRYNHLAIVDSARAGEEVRIKLDENDAVYIKDVVNNDSLTTNKEGGDTMSLPKLRIDSIDYEASQEVINRYNKLSARVDELETTNKTVTDEKDTVQAKLDTATEENKTLKERDIKSDVADAVKARIAVERVANVVLDEKDFEKLGTKLVNMDTVDVKKAIILKKFPDAKIKLDAEDVSDAYIDARFDTAAENIDSKEPSAIAQQRKQMSHTDSKDEEKGKTGDIVLDAREKMIESMKNDSKPVESK